MLMASGREESCTSPEASTALKRSFRPDGSVRPIDFMACLVPFRDPIEEPAAFDVVNVRIEAVFTFAPVPGLLQPLA